MRTEIPFQFSLWDSFSAIVGVGQSTASFQFSLWDSKRNSKRINRKIVCFQFSLWDSGDFDGADTPIILSSFNSLYEIRYELVCI